MWDTQFTPSSKRPHVVVGMSGGVDSSVAAALLVEQGYQVTGIMLRLWSEPGQATRRDNRCCTRDQMIDAHFVARKLGIPFQVVDMQEVFKRQVVDAFIDGYQRGITPNPCLACNRSFRFDALLDEAGKRGATHVATGHYARITQAADGCFELRKGLDTAKDQSYVLSVLGQRQLSKVILPLGEYTKPEIRQIASKMGLPVASKHDSQDLCFIADGDYRRFMRDHAPHPAMPGPIATKQGRTLGQHTGLANYTIGQRKGLGISYSEPLYVIAKDSAHNMLVVGIHSELGGSRLRAHSMNWISGEPPRGPMRAEVKIRYKSPFIPAAITPIGNDTADISLDVPVPDLTPGQGAVIYDGDRVVGGGLIALMEELSTPP